MALLECHQVTVAASSPHQLVVTPLLDDPALIQNHNLIALSKEQWEMRG